MRDGVWGREDMKEVPPQSKVPLYETSCGEYGGVETVESDLCVMEGSL